MATSKGHQLVLMRGGGRKEGSDEAEMEVFGLELLLNKHCVPSGMEACWGGALLERLFF